jgi:hypothetical protein
MLQESQIKMYLLSKTGYLTSSGMKEQINHPGRDHSLQYNEYQCSGHPSFKSRGEYYYLLFRYDNQETTGLYQ